MAAGSEPTSRARPRSGSEGATLVWLDSLAAGLCTAEAFLAAMHERFHGGEGNWEVLSLLDQYYRRGKLKLEVFQSVKSRLENSALGPEAEPVAGRRAPPAVATPPEARPLTTQPVDREAARARAAESAAADAARVRSAESVTDALSAPPAISRASAAVFREVEGPHPTQPVFSETVIPRASGPVDAETARPRPRVVTREVAIGDVLRGRYRVTRVLGHGGMGTVFEAKDEYRLDLPTAGRGIALKALHQAVTQQQELLCELQREFQHLQSLSHPNIVRVHEFDRDGGIAFFTMELLSGALLSRVLNARGTAPLPRPQALSVIRDIGAALAHAHSRGVLHGDVNPQNIFITNEGDLRVLDFGAAHHLPPYIDTDSLPPVRAPVATPGYASCELLEGQRPDIRDDLFAFACVAYLLLSGSHPFPERTALEARTRRVRPRRPPRLSTRQWRVLQEGLRWERERRPSDLQDWLTRFDLHDAAPHLPALPALVKVPAPRSRKTLAAVAAIVLLALVAAGGYWVWANHDSLSQSIADWRAPAGSEIPMPEASQTAALPEPPTASPAPLPAPRPSAPPLSAPPLSAPPSAAPASAQIVSPPTAPLPTRSQPRAIRSTVAAVAAVAVAAPSQPSSPAPVNFGPTRIEMAAAAVDVLPGDNSAHVSVRRRGNPHGAASFTWWTESGTAKPGADFVPVIPHLEQIADGQTSISLAIPVTEAPRSREKSFYVVIDQVDSGPALGARNLTMVTIQPPDAVQ